LDVPARAAADTRSPSLASQGSEHLAEESIGALDVVRRPNPPEAFPGLVQLRAALFLIA
jgi:hypothetical protein